MWREVTIDDALSAMSGPEQAKLKVAALGNGQTDALADIIREEVGKARGRIGACAQNILAAGDTVPDAVIPDLLVIVRHRMLSRVGLTATEERLKEYATAVQFFRDVAACKVNIERPEEEADANEQPAGSGRPGIRGRRRQFSRRHQDGI